MIMENAFTVRFDLYAQDNTYITYLAAEDILALVSDPNVVSIKAIEPAEKIHYELTERSGAMQLKIGLWKDAELVLTDSGGIPQ